MTGWVVDTGMWNNTKPKDYTDERAAASQHLEQLAAYPEYLASVKLARKIIPLTAGHALGTPAGSWADQIYRCATSVPANIAEGVGRMQTSQVVQFLRIARGSAFETVSHLLTAPVVIEVAELRREWATVVEMIDASVTRLIDG